MRHIRFIYLILLLQFPIILFSQSIRVVSFSQNPLEVSPLTGGSLQLSFSYSSQFTGNNIYVGLEELNSNNKFVRTIDGVSFLNQPAGSEVQLTANLLVSSIYPLSSQLPQGNYYQVIARLNNSNWTQLASAGYWNTPKLITQNSFGYSFSDNPISKGVDIGWMTEMEANGFTWKDNKGITKPLIPLLKEYNIDAVRLRVWVNPSVSGANGWCDIKDVVSKAILAKNSGMDIMVCIHYSDWWADPGKQNIPSAWVGMNISQLESAIANHTTDILNALKAVDITPKWVQIGNETNDGMLWSFGKASTGGFANYAKFVNAGSAAVKTFNNTIKTILHLANGHLTNNFQWNINGLVNNGLVFNRIDIIGMSLYPDASNWKSRVDDAALNIQNMKSLYNKESMMVEVGFPSNRQDISFQFLTYMIEKTRRANGLGVFYWEPITHLNWKSYSKGAWDDDGSPSVAMDAFLNTPLSVIDYEMNKNFVIFPNPSSDVLNINFLNDNINLIDVYSLDGKLMNQYKVEKQEFSINISN
ncbi:MAG TPA: hypothetical protein DDZ41_11235, partial [Flavobacterium sp.]|nr:hypothetical protein [Flavobacterium sp.]